MTEPLTPSNSEPATKETEALRSAMLRTSHAALVLQRRMEEELHSTKQELDEQTHALASSLSLLKATLEATPEGIVALDLAGRVVMWNERYLSLFNLSHDLMEQREHAALLSYCAVLFKEPEQFIESHVRLIGSWPQQAPAVFEMTTGHVLERWVLPQKVDGNLVGIVISWRDVTESRQAAALKAAKEAAEIASQAKSAFLSRVGHELRTPLNAVLGFSQLLEFDPDVISNSNLRNRVALVRQAGHHLLAMVDDILDVACIESGHLQLNLQPVTVAPLVAECLGLTASLAAARQITQTFTPSSNEKTARVLADPDRLRQVLANLLTNAVKYNRPHGQVTVVFGGDQSVMTIAIEDTGFGFSEQQRQKMFEPFNRLGAENSRIPGTGLGLVIARQLVGAMQGQLEVASTEGEGSTFTVRLQRA